MVKIFTYQMPWMKHHSVAWRWRGFETHRSIALRIHLLIPPAMIIPMEEENLSELSNTFDVIDPEQI